MAAQEKEQYNKNQRGGAGMKNETKALKCKGYFKKSANL
jgi:hypothetical protein